MSEALGCPSGMKYNSKRKRCELYGGKITQADIDRTKLNPSQRRLVETMKDVALDTMGKKPIRGIAEYQLASSFQTLFKLRNVKEEFFGRADLDRVYEANDAEDDILSFLKRAGVPYHPALCHKIDWERL